MAFVGIVSLRLALHCAWGEPSIITTNKLTLLQKNCTLPSWFLIQSGRISAISGMPDGVASAWLTGGEFNAAQRGYSCPGVWRLGPQHRANDESAWAPGDGG